MATSRNPPGSSLSTRIGKYSNIQAAAGAIRSVAAGNAGSASNSAVLGGASRTGAGGAAGSSSTWAATMRSKRKSRTPSASRAQASR